MVGQGLRVGLQEVAFGAEEIFHPLFDLRQVGLQFGGGQFGDVGVDQAVGLGGVCHAVTISVIEKGTALGNESVAEGCSVAGYSPTSWS